jgi:hypothetical protein
MRSILGGQPVHHVRDLIEQAGAQLRRLEAMYEGVPGLEPYSEDPVLLSINAAKNYQSLQERARIIIWPDCRLLRDTAQHGLDRRPEDEHPSAEAGATCEAPRIFESPANLCLIDEAVGVARLPSASPET